MAEVILKCGDYALIDKGNEYVVAYRYNESDGTWGQGRYFTPYPATEENKLYQLKAATEMMYSLVTGKIHPMRFQEIAEKCVAYLADECEDEEFLESELDLTEEEKEYFGVEY